MAKHQGLTGILLAATLAAAPAAGALAQDTAAADNPTLMVCADPENLPYSNKAGEGFENKIAALIAADMHMGVEFFFFPEHKTFLRRTLNDGACDLVVSVPAGMRQIAQTRPYFASSYVAITRADDKRHFTSFDDAWLRDASIGLQLVGNEGATTPPAVALSRRGVVQHITAFPMWAEEGVASPQGKIVDAVADGSIDVAFVWGPFAGYFARAHGAALRLEQIAADPAMPGVPFEFQMTMGVRKKDLALRDQVQDAIGRHTAEIAAILHDYGVPIAAAPLASASAAPTQQIQ